MELNKIKLNNGDKENRDEFFENLESTLDMDICENEVFENDEWMDQILFTIPYLEKALRNPNKNIVTEEEVVKIELIKKVTVESIKHLSKHTDLISEYDKETGDVIPSKILNAFKEENFITYENRFIYTLIKLIDDFITMRKKKSDEKLSQKNYKVAKYRATTRASKEKIHVEINYQSEAITERSDDLDENPKVKKIKEDVRNLKTIEVYKLMDSKKVALVKAPLKMTNVLLKNVNFQYAVQLYNYLTNQFGMKNKSNKIQKSYTEEGKLKSIVDETAYFEHLLITKNNNKKVKNKVEKEEEKILRDKITEKYIERIIEINPELAEQDLKEMIAKKIIKINQGKTISLKPLEDLFKNSIKEYLIKVEKMRLN